MDRERKLLYALAILAPIIEALTLVAFYDESDFSRQAAAIEQVGSCEERLARTEAACIRRPRHRPGI
jgi:hypothetical protein